MPSRLIRGMGKRTSKPELDGFIGVLLEATAQLSQIADHMCAYRDAGLSAPDAPPPAEVIRRLLGETLAPELNRREADLRCTTAILETTVQTIEREIYLIAIDAPDGDNTGPAIWN